MRYLLIFVTLLCLGLTAPIFAQNDCGAGLPCGPLPWPIPKFPIMLTPTPIPTVVATFLANPPQPTESPTPTPTATLFFDQAPFEDSVATFESVVNGTALPIVNPQGTAVNADEQIGAITANIGTFFSYFKGMVDISSGLGWFSVLIYFLMLLFTAFLTIKALTFFLPVFLAVLGLFKRVFDVIMEFIPL